jgi:DNA polymerase Ligase (LigD)
MPRFAILTHDHPSVHWDFLLENGPSCRTWRLLKSPDVLGEIPAEVIADHRLMYLDYEGPLSGDRGTVTQWDTGTFEWLVNGDDRIDVRLAGRKLIGSVRLTRIGGDAATFTFCRSRHHRSA